MIHPKSRCSGRVRRQPCCRIHMTLIARGSGIHACTNPRSWFWWVALFGGQQHFRQLQKRLLVAVGRAKSGCSRQDQRPNKQSRNITSLWSDSCVSLNENSTTTTTTCTSTTPTLSSTCRSIILLPCIPTTSMSGSCPVGCCICLISKLWTHLDPLRRTCQLCPGHHAPTSCIRICCLVGGRACAETYKNIYIYKCLYPCVCVHISLSVYILVYMQTDN